MSDDLRKKAGDDWSEALSRLAEIEERMTRGEATQAEVDKAQAAADEAERRLDRFD